jgi:hypothetical protein
MFYFHVNARAFTTICVIYYVTDDRFEIIMINVIMINSVVISSSVMILESNVCTDGINKLEAVAI